MTRQQLAVLHALTRRPSVKEDWGRGHRIADLADASGVRPRPTIDNLVAKGLAEIAWAPWDEDDRYRITVDGQLALFVADGRPCAWCERRAVWGQRLADSAASIYWCEEHEETGRDIAENQVSAARDITSEREGKFARYTLVGLSGREEPSPRFSANAPTAESGEGSPRREKANACPPAGEPASLFEVAEEKPRPRSAFTDSDWDRAA